jgi:5-methylcytosine-specific restriction endonuclease McrA
VILVSGALVLNATYEPLCVVPLRRAVVLVLAEKAVIVEAGDEVMHSERTSIPVPTVVRLSHFVRVPYRREVPLTRRAVLDRDGHQCVYCGNRADTIDHVRPRSRGGTHIWTNVVAACARCNHRKGDRLLGELGWHLHPAPQQPPATVAVVMGWAKRDPAWQRYLTWTGLEAGVAPAV